MVTVADLETAEPAQGVTVGAGRRAPRGVGPRGRAAPPGASTGLAGLHPECLPWLHEREVAVLGSDGISDPMPFVGIPEWPFPVHQIGITAMGLHLIDNVAAGAPRRARARPSGRWEFLFAMAPAADRPRHGLPGQPGGGAVSASHDELRALLQRYARAVDERDLDALAGAVPSRRP